MVKHGSRLIIKHFGTIKGIDFEVNKINIIIGDQCSGKSTIAKVLSFCQWAEKRRIIDGKFNYTIQNDFQKFHRIGDEYFVEDTYIEYQSDAVKISFGKSKKISFTIIDEAKYYKSKNIYVPAERNFATTIPNLGRYNETRDNIMNLLYDWNDAKKQYVTTKNILNIGTSFSYNEEEDEEYIHFESQDGKETRMPLRFASSGLQSGIPLVLLFDYLTGIFYEKEKVLSPFERELVNRIVKEELESKEILTESGKIDLEKLNKKIEQKWKHIGKYHFSKLIIEEPEQNLYPETQKELIYHFLKILNDSKLEHQLFITTHSPFILYSLNNCMMGYLVKSKMPEKEQNELPSRSAWMNPDLVSVWQLENGEFKDLKEEDTKVIGSHSFDEIMNKVMSEYFEMLGYFGDAE